ncbi:expressed unknown protein [Seminavis robusta]|uniref:G-protein coupled receptors family 1 profile domain-containing protein n=1 Tax=Seminavis robusta TaxID=568900 RepID=A0A9N8DU30_9STRA|nr:expressed unknown protein [Seminavis robusta]|eukprot:Sro249_g098760.1 n/a (412) ;mRNA; r:55165-56599
MHALGYPKIRIWELNETSTRHDHLIAAPSDEVLVKQWIGYAVLFPIFVAFNTLVFLSIILNKKTRINGFNQYLLAIMFPDILYTGFCGIQFLAMVINGSFYGHWCTAQSCALVFFLVSNINLNAVVAHEIKILLEASSRRQRSFPPSKKRIFGFVSASYLLGCIGGIICLFALETDSFKGQSCMPFTGETSTKIAYISVLPLVIFPILFVCVDAVQILRGGLLPKNGRTREIAIFFLRIFLVLVVMWVPALITVMVGADNIRTCYFIGLWSQMTGSVTSAFSLMKSDIREATVNLLRCRIRQANETFDDTRVSDGSVGKSRRGVDQFRNDRPWVSKWPFSRATSKGVSAEEGSTGACTDKGRNDFIGPALEDGVVHLDVADTTVCGAGKANNDAIGSGCSEEEETRQDWNA